MTEGMSLCKESVKLKLWASIGHSAQPAQQTPETPLDTQSPGPRSPEMCYFTL